MADVTTISFVVPVERALEFQRRAFQLLEDLESGEKLASSTSAPQHFVPAKSSDVRGMNVWKMHPWEPTDTDRAEWLVGALPDHPVEVLAILCEHPDQWVTGAELAERLGLDHGSKSVPPSFKSLANRCRRANRAPMWDYDNQHGYRVRAATAELFAPYLPTARS
jgi:hypothetical protein